MKQHTNFAFCPGCASPRIEIHQKNGMKCDDCGYVYFHNIAAAVAGIVEVDGKIVLMRRAHEPREGFLDLPGGFADYGESLEEALVREVREELSIAITDIRYFGSSPNTYVYKEISYFTADAFFLCRPVGNAILTLSDENTEIVLVDPETVDLETLAFKPMTIMLARYRELLKKGMSTLIGSRT